MADKIMIALNNSDSDFEKRTLQYIISLRDRQNSTHENQNRQVSELHFSEVLDCKSSSKINNSQLKDYSQLIQRSTNTELISSELKVPSNSIISPKSNDSFISDCKIMDADEDVKNLSLSIGFDSQLSKSYEPPKYRHSMSNQHSLKGSDIPEDLAKINLLDSLDDYVVRVIFNRGD